MTKTVIVRVNQGALKGKEVASTSGVTYYSFQGIPFAKPPVGTLRFKAPEPAEPWTGIRDALNEGAICPQIDMRDNLYKGDEDSLFLNVYTKELPPHAHSRAVMVWIHGGAFSMGSGNLDMFTPDHLLHEDVVVVSVNYRLGALEMRKNPNIMENFNRNWELLIPSDLGLNIDPKNSEEVASKIKKFYFGDRPISKDTATNYIDLLNDIHYFRGMNKTAKMMRSKCKIYCYQFSFEGKLGIAKPFIGCKDIPGVCHADEMGYITYMAEFDGKLEPDSAELKTLARMVKMWTNFAKSGDPTPELDPLLNVKWKSASESDVFYLDIDTVLNLRRNLAKERVQMWDELYLTANM